MEAKKGGRRMTDRWRKQEKASERTCGGGGSGLGRRLRDWVEMKAAVKGTEGEMKMD